MAGYRLHLLDGCHQSSEHLDELADLADRVALEQLAHELNPTAPAGYVVTFRVEGSEGHTVADGHFYVRATAAVTPALGSGNNPS